MMLKLDERLYDVNATYIAADESMQRLEDKLGLLTMVQPIDK
jgi:hypothetical protein